MMLCTLFDLGDFSIDICLFLLYCIVSFVLFVCLFVTSFMSDCCTTEFVDLRNDMYVHTYACIFILL